MAGARNLYYDGADENANRRPPRPQHAGLNAARTVLCEFMQSKKTEIRRMTNDPARVPYSRLIKRCHLSLKNELLYNRFLIYFPRRVMDMLHEFQRKVELLLRSEGHITLKKKFNYTLLDAAIATGYTQTIKKFFTAGFNINSTYNTSTVRFCIPLHRAAESRQSKALEFIIQHGANVNLTNYIGKTALFYAVEADDARSVEILLKYNAEINDPDILTAGILNNSSYIVELLLSHGANAKQYDICGRTPLHFVTGHKKNQVFQYPFECEDLRRSEVAKVLIESGADVNAETTSGITPLHAAALKGYSQVAEVLLTYGALVDFPYTDGKTALFFASFNAYSRTVSTLFKFGADVNIFDVNNKSALDMAYTAGPNRYTTICNPYDAHVSLVLRSSHVMEADEYESEHYIDYDHYDIDFYLQSRGRTIDVLEQQMVKMIAAGIMVRDELKFLINIYTTTTFKTECEKELKDIKNVILFNEITGLDIVKMDSDILTIYMRNPDIRDVLEGYDYDYLFPIYGAIVQNKIRVAIKKNAATSDPFQLGTVLVMPGFTPLFPIFSQNLIIA